MARAGLTAERLYRAGAELADEVGFAQVTVSSVARHFGVAAASLYSHVPGSGDLKAGIALLALDELAERAGSALAGRSGIDALVALADSYRDYAREHPGRFDAAQYRLDPATAARSAGPRHAEMARAVLRGYPVPEGEQVHAVRLIGSVLNGFVRLETAGSFDHSAPPPAQSWRRVLQALDSTLRNWEGSNDHE
jgi:AcrR family transcriptional regulator